MASFFDNHERGKQLCKVIKERIAKLNLVKKSSPAYARDTCARYSTTTVQATIEIYAIELTSINIVRTVLKCSAYDLE